MMDTAYSSAITRNPQLIKAAIAYANRGWQVVPLWPLQEGGRCTCPHSNSCTSQGKHPWVRWAEEGGTTNELQIYKWWRSRPGSGIGVLTGKYRSGLFLLDVDGPAGIESLAGKHLPLTPVSNTGKGNHYLFEYPENVNISTSNKVKFLPGLDVRGDGGLFVAPPSLHYSGVVYEWDVSPDEVELAKCPDWLVEALAVEDKQEYTPREIIPGDGNSAYAKSALKNEAENVRCSIEGTRNKTLFVAAASMAELIAGGEINEIEVYNELYSAGLEAGLTAHETKQTIKSGFDTGKKQPRNAPKPPQLSDMRGGVWVEETGEVLPSKPQRAALVTDDRPELPADEADLKVITPLAWEVLYDYNNPPRLFSYGDRLQRFQIKDDKWMLQEINENILRFEVTQAAWWFKINKNKEKVSAVPPKHIIQNMLSEPSITLPILTRVVEVPVFSPEGILIEEPGYHESGIYYNPVPGLKVDRVPKNPTDKDVQEALDLVHELIYDFPFMDEKEKANALTVFVEPFLREMIKGCTPLRLIEAATPGSGKGLLADVLTQHATGQRGLITQCQTEEEWNKSIISQLRANAPSVLIDNINTTLDSGALAAVLTSEQYGGRLLGTNDTVQYPNRILWLATGNNPTMTTEIARRTVRIRLDPKQDMPWQRVGFKHEELREWAESNRPRFIWAALTLVQNWISKGQPKHPGKSLGSFESWSKVLGGVLHAAGIEGFLENLDEFYEAADLEGTMLRNFVHTWFENFGTEKVTIGQLFSLSADFDGIDLGRGGERAQRIHFGKFISKQRNRVVGGYVVLNKGMSKGNSMWKLMPTTQEQLL